MAFEGMCMGDEMRRPPRWADALLRVSLNAQEAETESGDLLEAYRDSIYPTRGRWHADLWFMRQVIGYILWGRGMQLRNWLLVGLALTVLTIVFSALMYPGLLSGSNAAKVAAIFLFYGYVAVRYSHPATPGDAVVLRLGTRYGMVIGALWIVGYVDLNTGVVGVGFLFPLIAFLLPLVAGAHGSIRLWGVRAGTQVGFWSGLISGLMVFLFGMAMGYILAFVPGLPGAEIPANHAYNPVEYQRLNVSDTLGGGLAHLFGFGGIFSVISGTIGGLAGILLARTGRGPEEPRRILWTTRKTS
jgi:hypothetical protein